MSDLIQIACPHCAMPMQLARPQAKSLVTCPTCGRELQVDHYGTASPVQAALLAGTPGPIFDAVPSPPPNHPGLPPRPARQSNKPKRSLTGPLLAIVLLATIVGIGIAAYSYREPITALLKPRLPADKAHQLVLGRSSRKLREVSQLMDVIRQMSVKNANEKLSQFANDFRTLTIQAADLPPLDRQQIVSLEEWAIQNIAPEQLASLLAEPNEQRMRLSSRDPSKTAAVQAEFAINDFLDVVKFAWQAIPQPDTEIEQIEWDVVRSVHRVWAAQYQVTDSDQYQALATTFNHASRRLSRQNASYSKRNSGDGLMREQSPYLAIFAALYLAQTQRFAYLERQFGALDRALGYQTFVTATNQFLGLDPNRLQNLAYENGQAYRLGDSGLKDNLARLVIVESTRREKTDQNSGAVRSQGKDRDPVDDDFASRSLRASSEFSQFAEAKQSQLANDLAQSGYTDDSDDVTVELRRAERLFRQQQRGETITVIEIDGIPEDAERFFHQEFSGRFSPDAIDVKAAGNWAIVLMVYQGRLGDISRVLPWADRTVANESERRIRITYRGYR